MATKTLSSSVFNESISFNTDSQMSCGSGSMMYVNHFSVFNQLLTRINDIDQSAIDELSKNLEFENFVRECLDTIAESKTMTNIRIERLDNMDEKSFRILYYVDKVIDTSFISSNDKAFRRKDRPTYVKILRHLFKKSNDLNNMVVIDERSF